MRISITELLAFERTFFEPVCKSYISFSSWIPSPKAQSESGSGKPIFGYRETISLTHLLICFLLRLEHQNLLKHPNFQSHELKNCKDQLDKSNLGKRRSSEGDQHTKSRHVFPSNLRWFSLLLFCLYCVYLCSYFCLNWCANCMTHPC